MNTMIFFSEIILINFKCCVILFKIRIRIKDKKVDFLLIVKCKLQYLYKKTAAITDTEMFYSSNTMRMVFFLICKTIIAV